jgi:hypothetical protein
MTFALWCNKLLLLDRWDGTGGPVRGLSYTNAHQSSRPVPRLHNDQPLQGRQAQPNQEHDPGENVRTLCPTCSIRSVRPTETNYRKESTMLLGSTQVRPRVPAPQLSSLRVGPCGTCACAPCATVSVGHTGGVPQRQGGAHREGLPGTVNLVRRHPSRRCTAELRRHPPAIDGLPFHSSHSS